MLRIFFNIILSISLPLAAVNQTAAENGIVWANEVIGMSKEQLSGQFGAAQSLGEPSSMPYDKPIPCAWTIKSASGVPIPRIELGFKDVTQACQLAILGFNLEHSVDSIEISYERGNKLQISLEDRKANVFKSSERINIYFADTLKEVHSVILYLTNNNSSSASQIDAIGISCGADTIRPQINLTEQSADKYRKENLGLAVNSRYYELAPVISPDGKRLYYTRDEHPANIGIDKRQDVWYSDIDSAGSFQRAINIGSPINTADHNFIFSVTQDGNALLLGNIYNPDGSLTKGISVSTSTGDKWSYPQEVKIENYYNRSTGAGFCLASSGKALVMSIKRDDTYGGQDIYVSLLDDSVWTEPKNLGSRVNTAANDDTPFLAADGVTLYYSTSGHPGYGDNDMFMTRRLDSTWTKWSEPVNLGPQINTSGWDAYYTIPAKGDWAYYVSNEGSRGAEDIFRIELPEELKPKVVALVKGRVLNSKDSSALSAKIFYEELPSGKEAGVARSNPKTGEYKIVLPAGKKYGFLAESRGFIAVNENLDLTDFNSYAEFDINLSLVPIETGQKIRLNNIFFEFGKFDLLEDSYSELNRVMAFLKEYPEIIIEIQGHTDNVGSNRDNQILSEKRARSVADYLMNKGIPAKRLLVKGYGETKPIMPNDSETNRRINRRVEFLLKR